jgi:flavodoxin
MKTLVVYDSMYGNTEKIAQAIGDGVGGEVSVRRAGEVNAADLQGLDLLFIGSPTQGGKATQPVQEFLGRLPAGALKATRVASFDTRLSWFFLKAFGFAAGKIAGSLESGGVTLAAPPEGFYVKGSQGPRREGELERAAAWAEEVAGRPR